MIWVLPKMPICGLNRVRYRWRSLDTLSSDDDGEWVIPRDISVTVLCGSEDDHTLVGSDQVLSDVDLPKWAPSSTVPGVHRYTRVGSAVYHSPSFWVDRLGEECAMTAAVNLQRDTGLMLSNL